MTEKVTFKSQPGPAGAAQPRINPRVQGRSISGKIAAIIGSGDEAKNSFIWVTIRWSFIIGSIMTAAIFLRPIVFCTPVAATDFVEDAKAIWTIFMPVITLALGYSFGKGR